MIQLRDYQRKILNSPEIVAILHFLEGKRERPEKTRPVVVSPTGSGKCLGKGTPVLLFNGKIKPVEDIVSGDKLMGPDSKPRTVLSTCSGREMLYRIIPTKGTPYVVNESHILSLRMTNGSKRSCGIKDGEIVDISVSDYLGKTKTFRHCAKGWRTGVDWPFKHTGIIDPYFLGVWLGDGSSKGPEITTADDEIIAYLKDFAKFHRLKIRKNRAGGKSNTYALTTHLRPGRGIKNNAIRYALESRGLLNNKHIPEDYKINSRRVRLELLAGLIDTDGSLGTSGYDFISKWKHISDDVAFVARSLGLAAYVAECKKSAHENHDVTYWRVSISGDVDEIPVRINRKRSPPRKQKKNVLNVGIKTEKIGVGDYYGFQIDGDGRFLLGDFTVTHNTAMFCAIANYCKQRRLRVLVLVHRREILAQTLRSMHNLGLSCGQIASGRPMTSDLIQVAMIGTIIKRLDRVPRPDLILIDEGHHVTESNSWGRVLKYWSSVPMIGWTATLIRLDGNGFTSIYDSVIQGPQPSQLVADGWLSMPVLYRPAQEITEKYHLKRGDFDTDEQEKTYDVKTEKGRRIVGDVIAHYRKHLDGLPVIVSCVSVNHAKTMAEIFTNAGYSSRAVWGEMNDSDRDAALTGLGDGSVQVVTFDSLIGEGVDIPAVSGVIMLRRTMSLALYLQIVGRALRPVYMDDFDLETIDGRRNAQLAGPKPRAIILDHAGNYHIHGHVLTDRVWTLDSTRRALKGQPVPTTTSCPRCFGVWPGKPRLCPACGFEFKDTPVKAAPDIKVLAGELIASGIDAEHADSTAAFVAAALRADGKTRSKMLLGKAFSLAVDGDKGLQTLGALAQSVGYKDGWTRWAWSYVNEKRRA